MFKVIRAYLLAYSYARSRTPLSGVDVPTEADERYAFSLGAHDGASGAEPKDAYDLAAAVAAKLHVDVLAAQRLAEAVKTLKAAALVQLPEGRSA